MPEDNLEDYSGRISLRVPRSLHKKIIEAAKKEGVSANLYLTHLISLGLGEKVAQENRKEE
jgi:antitoxin HicB